MNISLEEFNKVYNKHLPNKFIVFLFKLADKDDEKTTGIKISILDKIAYFVLLPLVVLGILFRALNLPEAYVGAVTIPYSILLAIIVLSGFVAVKWNNFRIKKIAKELGISIEEYNKLVDSLFG
jgi:hypothetical protein